MQNYNVTKLKVSMYIAIIIASCSVDNYCNVVDIVGGIKFLSRLVVDSTKKETHSLTISGETN